MKRAFAVTAVLLLAVIVYGIVAWQRGRNRSVWLVNGLESPYEVVIDGQAYTVPPARPIEITIVEGAVEIEPGASGIQIPAHTVTVETPWLTRPLARPTFIINPDASAPLVIEEYAYSSDGDAEPRMPYVVIAPGTLHELDFFSYRFEQAPDSIETSSNGTVYRERIEMLRRAVNSDIYMGVVIDELGVDGTLTMLDRRLDIDSSLEEDVAAFTSLAEPQRTIAEAKERLAVRPVLVEWHRAYQSVTKSVDDDHDLVPTYRAMLEAEPENTALMYLLGRVVEDPDESEALWERAGSGDAPCWYGPNALAWEHLTNGHFAEAAVQVERAIALGGETPAVEQIRRHVREALGEWEALLAESVDARRGREADIWLTTGVVYALGRLGRVDDAHEVIRRYGRLLPGVEVGVETRADTRRALEIVLACATDDVDAFLALADRMPDDYGSDAALLRGDLDEAARRLDAAESAQTSERLILYAAAKRAGNAAIAESQRGAAVAALAEARDPSWRSVASWLQGGLQGEDAPDEKAVRALSLEPADKRVALLALGAAFPDDRERYWNLAERLNFDRAWPYLLVRHVLADG